jgi:hypothetical protein
VDKELQNYWRNFKMTMNAFKLTFATIITVFASVLILSVLHTSIENVNVDATSIGRCPDELTGKWNGNDGGTYWIRQDGSKDVGAVMWFGTSGLGEGTLFSNVFMEKEMKTQLLENGQICPWEQ